MASMVNAVVGVQASKSSCRSLVFNDPNLWDFLLPMPTRFADSLVESPSCTTVTFHSSPPSSFNGSPASTLSDFSSFSGVLQQMVATPSPATAAALVRSPASSTLQFVEASGLNTAAAMLLSPSSSSGLLMAAPGSATPALRVCTPPSEQRLAATFASSPSAPALSCQADVSAGCQPSSLHSPRFSGSPVAGLCQTGPDIRQIRVRLTNKQQVRLNNCCTHMLHFSEWCVCLWAACFVQQALHRAQAANTCSAGSQAHDYSACF